MLLFKLLCTPLLMWLSIVVARRWGPFAGGCIAGLPTISGPISLCIALEQGPAFAAAVAYNAMLGVGAVCLFALSYAWISRSRPWFVALFMAEAAYFSVGWAVGFVPHLVALAVVVGLAGPVLTLLGLPAVPQGLPGLVRPQAWWIVPLQMLLGALLVFAITEAALRLGSQWSGVLAFYPVMITILAPFCHAVQGPHAARQLMAGLMTGFVGGTSFCCVVLFAVEAMPLVACYSLALCVSLMACFVASKRQQR